jgi:hypothetical protein
MHVSRNSAAVGALLLTVLAAAAPDPVRAQIGPPIRLAPPAPADASPSPGASQTAPAAPESPSRTLTVPGLPAPAPPIGGPSAQNPASVQIPTGEGRVGAPSGIKVDTLAAPDPDRAGALAAGDRALPPTLWDGTSRAVVTALLPRIAPTTSPTLADLAYRLLASPAQPPAPSPGTGETDGSSLLAMRADRLIALGRVGAARDLLDALPRDKVTEPAAIARVEAAFLSNDAAGACAAVRDKARQTQGASGSGFFWDQAMITCQALAGEQGPASVSLAILRDQKGYKDDGFAALVDRVLGSSTKIDTLPNPQALSLILFQAAKLPLPKDVPVQARPAALRTIALSPNLPIEQRITAGERAAAVGALPAGSLAEIFAATPLAAEDEENPIARADQLGGARGRAMLYALARKTAAPAGRGALIAAMLIKAPRADVYPVVARLVAPMLAEMPPSDALKPLAVEFARALFTSDHLAEARTWFSAADPAAAASLVPVARIAERAAAPDWDKCSLVELYTGPGGKKDATAARKATLAATLLSALGDPAPDEAVLGLLPPDGKPPQGAVPATQAWLLLHDAASGQRIGATVLATLVMLGEDGASASPLLLERAIDGLARAGLRDEARHLALDAAIAGGL